MSNKCFRRCFQVAVRCCAAAVIYTLGPAVLAGQTPGGLKSLTPDTYDSWRSIVGQTLSPDGKWVAYTLTPAVGDGEVIIRSTEGTKEYHIPRGFTGRPLNNTYGTIFRPGDLKFTADGRRLVFLRYDTKAEFDKARRERKKDGPVPAVVVVDLENGSASALGNAFAFTLPKNTARYVIFAAPRDTSLRDSVPLRAAASPGGTPRPVSKDSMGKGRYQVPGVQLTIQDFQKGSATHIDDVDSYVIDDDATWLAYAVSSDEPAHDGVYLRRMGTTQDVAVIIGPGHYKGLVLDSRGRQLAFVSDKSTYTSSRPRYALYYTPIIQPRVRLAVSADRFGNDTTIASSNINFSKNGAVVAFGVMPMLPDSIPPDSLADKAVYDLWNYKDARLPTEQRTNAAKDRERSYLTIYNVATRAVTRVGNEGAPGGLLSNDGRWVCVADESPYEMASAWDDEAADLYLVDVMTGAHTMLAHQMPLGPTSFSPGGRYLTWFDRGFWYTYNLQTGITANVTSSVSPVHFDNETEDTPSIPGPWGLAGWTRGDARLLVYSRYDVWSIDPNGADPPIVVTDSLGVRRQIVFRVVRPHVPDDDQETEEAEDSSFDASQPVLLSAMNDVSKAAGFFQAQLDVRSTPTQLVMDTARFGTPLRARHDSMYVVTRETERAFPNLYVGRNLAALARVSDANPQQKEYRWPTAELVRWYNADGIPLSGILYKPSDFDPARQYPMIVYFYERMSDNLHVYHAPSGRNVINPSVYTSRGYLVFEPDIKYTVGSPGMSVVKSVLPGVQTVLARGYVNPQAIGCAGQSWGGYEAAFLVTQTTMFKACFVGAPVANMTSAYGAIRWETGHARQFQYERTQSRIGGSLWQARDRYIENSPLFYADHIETPLLIMANDHDGAVPWYQGIELFSAMRRLGKEAYMVSYNGDGHNPVKYANRKDIDMKMLQFFGHHLMGEPAPEWMEKGIPFLQKGRDQLTPSGGAPASP